MATVSLEKVRGRAIQSGKMSAKRSYIRMLMDSTTDVATPLTDEAIEAVLGKMPGNIGDDTYCNEVVAVLRNVENPKEVLDKAEKKQQDKTPAISAQVDKTPQGKLARETGAAFPSGMCDEMEADYQAVQQGKEAPFHCLSWLLKTFGPDADSNQFKNTLGKWPRVDSQLAVKDGKAIEVEVPFVSRFKEDAPAKYQVRDGAGKFVDFDFYNLQLDYSPKGKAIKQELDAVEKEIASGTNQVLEGKKKLLQGKRTNLRNQLKNAMRAYQQMEDIKAIDGVDCDFNRDKEGNLARPYPVYFWDESKPATNNKHCDMGTFLSFKPSDKSVTDYESLIASKPPKATRGSKKKTGTQAGAEGDKVALPSNLKQFESYMAMAQHFSEDKTNALQIKSQMAQNKLFRNTMFNVLFFLKSTCEPFQKAYDKDLSSGAIDSDRDLTDAA